MRATFISKPASSRRGFALVMTLAVLAITAAVLTRLGTKGLALTLEARTQEELLQAKWTKVSCRLALLDSAERLLGDSDALVEAAGAGWPYPAERSASFVIGGVRFHALLADEQAKLSLNAAHRLRPERVGELLLDAQRVVGVAAPLRRDAMRPNPLLVAGDRVAYQGWGQLFDLARLRTANHGAAAVIELARLFSYREDERVNVRRATDVTLRQTARLVLTPTEAETLVEARAGHAGELRDLLDSLDLPRRRVILLRRLLTERSGAYSLWLWTKDASRLTVATTGMMRGDSTGQELRWP